MSVQPTQVKPTAIKYGEWRPIGVCDNGSPQQVKAKIFHEEDLRLVTAPGIDRNNWQNSPQVLKIIHKYAKDVAKISAITKGMKRPQVQQIKLIGAVLSFDKTPGLNRESEDGKVQLFQVEFVDRPKLKSTIWRSLIALILVLGLLIGVVLITLLVLERINKPTLRQENYICDRIQSPKNYEKSLQRLHQSLGISASALPERLELATLKKQCFLTQSTSSELELSFISCINLLHKLPERMKDSFQPNYDESITCAVQICTQPPLYLEQVCESFHRQLHE